MRKIWITVTIGILAVTSCVKASKSPNNPNEAEQAAIVTRLTTTETFQVPVKNGCVTKVEMDGNVIAEAISPMTILVPRSVPTSKAEGLTYSFIPVNEYPNEITQNTAKLYQVICFEDSRTGDYDYNDLVIHVKYQTKGNLFGLGVHPIALGSTKSIYLGCIVYKGNTEIFNGLLTNLGKDCRNQYFKDQPGFINTVGKTSNFFPQDKETSGWHQYLASTIRCWDISKYTGEGAIRVEWFIEVEGNTRLYALSTNYLNESFDKNGLPLGFVVSNTGTQYTDKGTIICGHDWFNYPMESKHLNTAYPELWNWLTTSTSKYNFSDIYSATVPDNAFPAADIGLFSVTDFNFCTDKYLQN